MAQWNQEQAQQKLSPAYESSSLNPEQAETLWPGCGAWYAAIQAEAASGYEDICLGKHELAQEKALLAESAEAIFAGNEAPEAKAAKAQALWKAYLLKTAKARAFDFAKGMTVIGSENPYTAILAKANPLDDSWMEAYGLPVTQLDRDMMRFWFSLPKEKLVAMGHTIVDAFLHGFISQSRDRRDRTRVRFFYQLGQEALAQEVVKAFAEKGLNPVITTPHTVYMLNQCQVDHQFDRFYQMDQSLYEAEWDAHQEAMHFYEQELKDTCGMVGIDQLGMEATIIRPCRSAFQLDAKAREWFAKLGSKKADLESQWIKPSEISFCKVAFPNKLVGDRFEEVFADFFAMNAVVSEPYELLQQVLIDGLDTCESVHIKGYRGNDTDLCVQLWPIEDPAKQTKFLNCGGDLNIPYGEIFTTPKLTGTNGILHVEQICLKGVFYHDLRLTFENGWVVKAESADGPGYVQENLLYPQTKIPMGEFAIGTNTSAYAIAQRYDIGSRLPILIYEKMGPHIAIGDPCFARSEDVPIYNMYDRKDMVCRQNEVTMERNIRESVYFGKHVDITLPYHQVEYLRGVRADGTTVDFIREGRFVLENTEGLNEGLN